MFPIKRTVAALAFLSDMPGLLRKSRQSRGRQAVVSEQGSGGYPGSGCSRFAQCRPLARRGLGCPGLAPGPDGTFDRESAWKLALDRGDFDWKSYVRKIENASWCESILLHTYGLPKSGNTDYNQHLERSLAAWKAREGRNGKCQLLDRVAEPVYCATPLVNRSDLASARRVRILIRSSSFVRRSLTTVSRGSGGG